MPAFPYRYRRYARARRLALGGLVGAGALVLAACGSSTGTTASSTTAPSTTATSTTAVTPTTAATPTSLSSPGVTISAGSASGLGSVLVNSKGETLYLLTSEQGGKLTCTAANGCTTVWPPTALASGTSSATAGTGVVASMLGTIKTSSGTLWVTYAGWPLYTFSHDSGPGSANGEGITSFGGTWEAITPAGTPIPPTPSGTSGSSTTTTVYHY